MARNENWEFRQSVAEEIARAATMAHGMRYVTYAIRDPSQKDDRGHPDGPRFYVGQSKQVRIRAGDHMKEGGRATSGGSQKASRIYRIMKDGFVPRFEILESTDTLLRSLISETLWARRSNWLGYQLENHWPEHQGSEAPQGLQSVLPERAWAFTVREAIEDGVTLHLQCRPCGLDQEIDLSGLRDETPLKNIRSLKLQCPTCSGGLLRARLPAELRPFDGASLLGA